MLGRMLGFLGMDARAARNDAEAAAWSHPLWLQKCLGISRLMRTKEINWWFRPNETAVQINSPHQQKQTEPLKESGLINRGSGGTICAPLPGTGLGGGEEKNPPELSIKPKFSGLFMQAQLDTTILPPR